MSKVWFITGSSSGFGKQFVEQLIARGEKVVATARDPKNLFELEKEIPHQLLVAALDVRDRDQIDKAVNAATEKFGRIDVVVNNAGYSLKGMLEEYTEEQIQKQFEVNVFGLINVVRATLPVLKKQLSGHYLNFSSVMGTFGVPTFSLYSASKFAVEGLSDTMAAELQSFGIKTTAVEPSLFATDFAGRSMEHTERLPEYEAIHEGINKMIAGWAAGDPAKAVHAIITMVESSNPPVHFPVGASATVSIRQTLEKRIEEVNLWADLASNT
ncbi:SDR family NAD(P)-dependent oxidoreductase, partial [Paenibacillus sp. TAF58]